MKRILVLAASAVLISLSLFNCATGSYGTSQFRASGMDASNIALSDKGLSQDQIAAILSTQFPPEKPVSMALFYLARSTYYGSVTYNPTPAIIKKLNGSKHIERIVPVPKIMIPAVISFDAIQQIGIRSLSEYSIVFYGDSENVFFSYKSPAGQYMISSTLEFLIIDNKTTAIIASDKLFSEIQTPMEFFTDKEYQQSLEKIYQEQADILGQKIADLFKGKKE